LFVAIGASIQAVRWAAHEGAVFRKAKATANRRELHALRRKGRGHRWEVAAWSLVSVGSWLAAWTVITESI
jgi:hypothetical protein